jgi:hypothetical protein
MFTSWIWPILFAMVHLCCHALERGQATEEKREMDMWDDGEDPPGMADWSLGPTWHKTVGWNKKEMGRDPEYIEILTLANAFFNWVVEQADHRPQAKKVVVSA